MNKIGVGKLFDRKAMKKKLDFFQTAGRVLRLRMMIKVQRAQG